MREPKPIREPLQAEKLTIKFIGEARKLSDTDIINDAVTELTDKPATIHMFTDGADSTFHVDEMQKFLSDTVGPNFTVVNEGDLTVYLLKNHTKEEVASSLAQAKRWVRRESGPLTEEEKIVLEIEVMDHGSTQPFRDFARAQGKHKLRPGERPDRLMQNSYYDGEILAQQVLSLLPSELVDRHTDRIDGVVIISGRGVGSGELDPRVPHAHSGMGYRNVQIVSTTGLVEGPQEPQGFLDSTSGPAYESWGGIVPPQDPNRYKIYSNELKKNGVNGETQLEALKAAYADQMLTYEDPRLTDVSRGVVLQQTLKSLGQLGKISRCSTTDFSSHEPDLSKTCFLHDAHRQEEQMQERHMCGFHEKFFTALKSVQK